MSDIRYVGASAVGASGVLLSGCRSNPLLGIQHSCTDVSLRRVDNISLLEKLCALQRVHNLDVRRLLVETTGDSMTKQATCEATVEDAYSVLNCDNYSVERRIPEYT